MDWEALLNRKYDILGEQAAASTTSAGAARTAANARATLDEANAGQVAPLARAQIAESGARSGLYGAQADTARYELAPANPQTVDEFNRSVGSNFSYDSAPRLSQPSALDTGEFAPSPLGGLNTGTAKVGMGMRGHAAAPSWDDQPASPEALHMLHGAVAHHNMQEAYCGGTSSVSHYADGTADAQPAGGGGYVGDAGRSILDTIMSKVGLGGGGGSDDQRQPQPRQQDGKGNLRPAGYSGGTDSVSQRGGMMATTGKNRVPGKGDGTVDKVKAVLAPKEAVLNEEAAEMLGRDKIAALNAAGLAARHAKEESGEPDEATRAAAKAQGSPGKPAGGAKPSPAMRQPGKAPAPASGPARKPLAKAGGHQELAHGTHEVKAGKSAPTPKIDPAMLQHLLGALGGGGGQPGGGMGMPMPQRPPGGMV